MSLHFFLLYDTYTLIVVYLMTLCVFFLGLFGFLCRSNHYIYLVICNEIMLFSLILQLLLLGAFFDDITPQLFVLFLLLLSSAEVVIVLSIIIRYYKLTQIIYIKPVYFIINSNKKE